MKRTDIPGFLDETATEPLSMVFLSEPVKYLTLTSEACSLGYLEVGSNLSTSRYKRLAWSSNLVIVI